MTRTTEEKIVTSHETRQLTEFPAFQKAIQACRAHYTNQWLNSDPQRPGDREMAYYCQSALSMVENQLRQFVADGKAADREIEAARKKHGN